MPQQFYVLQCASPECAIYQVQQAKKANKWECKVCGLKQPVAEIFLESTKPKDCRETVQRFNMQHTRGYDPQHSASVVHEGLEFRRPSAVKSEVKEEEKEGVCWYEEERKRSLMTLKKPTKIASGGSEVRGSVEVKKEENPENIGSTLLREGWRPSNGKAKLMIYDRIKQQRHREAPY